MILRAGVLAYNSLRTHRSLNMISSWLVVRDLNHYTAVTVYLLTILILMAGTLMIMFMST